jgi:hypothetical protein
MLWNNTQKEQNWYQPIQVMMRPTDPLFTSCYKTHLAFLTVMNSEPIAGTREALLGDVSLWGC